MRILITRPEPDAARTAARLEELGHRAVIDSLLTPEALPVDGIPAGPFAALAVTSANAMRAAGKMKHLEPLHALPLFAVGEHTAQAARAAGFAKAESAGGDAHALAALIATRLARSARVLHLAGEDRAQDLGALLAPGGITVEVLVLYRVRTAQAFAAETVAELTTSAIDVVLHYSPRSAAAFAALAGRHGLVPAVIRLRHLCLSQAVAAPLAAIGARPEIATRPDEAALFELLGG